MAYTSQYPTQDADHVKATTVFVNDYTNYAPWFSTDPTNSVTGGWHNWIGDSFVYTNRFHIDLGSGHVIKRIYIENGHSSGGFVDRAVKNFTFWGSNNAAAFAELTYATDTNWTQLTTDPTIVQKHPETDTSDPQYFTVTNSTSYQYYAFKFGDCWSATYQVVRRIELQTEDGYTPPSGFISPFPTFFRI